MKKWLFDPFIYVAGTKALVLGWLAMLLTAVIAFYSKAHFDGIIDVHIGKVYTLSVYLLEQLVDWSVVVLVFYPAGLLFSRSAIRFIDIAGTMALARWVMIFPALLALCIPAEILRDISTAKYNLSAAMDVIVPLILVGLATIIFAIWMIAMMYKAFAISFNMKGGKATIVFIISLLIAEILSKIILHQLYQHFI